MDAGGGGRRLLQIASAATRFRGRGPRGGLHNEEVAGGSEGPRRALLLRQAPRLLRKCCRAVQAGSLIVSSVLFSLEGSAARYPPGPPLGKPLLPPLAFQNIGVGKRCICHCSSSSMRVLACAMDAGGGGRRPLQIASVATRFCGRGLRGGFHNGGWFGRPTARLVAAPGASVSA